MPIQIEYTDDGGVIITARGQLGGGDIVATNDKIYATPEMTRKIVYQICDLTRAAPGPIAHADIEQLALQDEKAAAINPDMLIAIVGNEDILFGLSRMWESLVSGAPIETYVCRTVDEARQWVRQRLAERSES